MKKIKLTNKNILIIIFGGILSCDVFGFYIIKYFEQIMQWNLLIGILLTLVYMTYGIFILALFEAIANIVLRSWKIFQK